MSFSDQFCNTIYEKGYGSAAIHLVKLHGGLTTIVMVSYAPEECCRALQEAGGKVLLLNTGDIHLVGSNENLLEAAKNMKPLEVVE